MTKSQPNLILKVPDLIPARHPWMMEPGVRAIMEALARAGGEARFVGGAVRDALLGLEVGDVDLAVNLPPAKVMAVLRAAGIKAVPTGFEHGTVTAIKGQKAYELTTLRKDVEADGRHAKVAFTGSWETDASRRDFTINALYVDAKGKLYDYFGGLEDLKVGHIRFIGNPCDRIREDHLRILRFFRFYAWFGRAKPDQAALNCCQACASLIRQLSVERVWKELKRLLLAADPLKALDLMIRTGVITPVLPGVKSTMRLRRLMKLEERFKIKADPLRRLAALLGRDQRAVKALVQRLRLSNHEKDYLVCLTSLPRRLRGRTKSKSLRQILYDEKSAFVRDGLLLAVSQGHKINLKQAFAVLDQWESPILPIQGRDIVRQGIKSGPRVGNILRAIETWWRVHDFKPGRHSCLAYLKRLTGKKKTKK